jgi:hypothetical protein
MKPIAKKRHGFLGFTRPQKDETEHVIGLGTTGRGNDGMSDASVKQCHPIILGAVVMAGKRRAANVSDDRVGIAREQRARGGHGSCRGLLQVDLHAEGIDERQVGQRLVLRPLCCRQGSSKALRRLREVARHHLGSTLFQEKLWISVLVCKEVSLAHEILINANYTAAPLLNRVDPILAGVST